MERKIEQIGEVQSQLILRKYWVGHKVCLAFPSHLTQVNFLANPNKKLKNHGQNGHGFG